LCCDTDVTNIKEKTGICNNNNNNSNVEREKLPKLKTNSKLINLQGEIHGVIEELLEKDEMDITDINNLIYAAATIMTQTLNEPSKMSKNRRNVQFGK
jgi:hypothetical protein